MMILVICRFTLPHFAQIIVNEVCTKNTETLFDFEGDSPDFIEFMNVSDQPVSLEEYALSDEDAPAELWQLPDIDLPPQGVLVVFASGKNIFGAENHTSFKLNSAGELLHLFHGSSLTDFLIPPLHADDSYGIDPTSGETKYFDTPTPGTSNITTPYLGYSNEFYIDKPSGFYASGINIHCILENPDETVFYTLDGSTPSANALPYSGEISIQTSVSLRVVAINPGYLPSDIQTYSYFVGVNKYMPVVSITTAPNLLFDPDSGLYMTGPNASLDPPYYGANYWNNKHVPVHVDYFVNQNLEISQDCELRMHGGKAARVKPQHALRLIAKKKYGHKYFEDNLIPLKPLFRYKKFVLRNGGGDWNHIHFTDGFIQNETLKGDLKFYCKGSHPVVVYINGEYFGVQDIQEKIDQYFCLENAGLKKDVEINLLEDDTISLFGDFSAFDAMVAFFESHDLAQTENYAIADTLLDLEGFTDYLITEIFWNNLDWPANNVKYWKSDTAGSKWKYILFDVDVSLNSVGFINESTDNLERILQDFTSIKHVKLFISLLQNEGFKNYFINRYADLVNTAYKAEILTEHLQELVDYVKPEMEYHFARWGSSVQFWEEFWLAPRAFQYVQNRSAISLNQLESNFQLDGQYNLHLDTWPPDAGQIHLNSIVPGPLPWTGIYFRNVPVDFQAIPATGYVFDHWEHTSNSEFNKNQNPAQSSFDQETTLTAIFKPQEFFSQLAIYPNPAISGFTVSSYHEQNENGTFSIYDMTGKILLEQELMFSAGINKTPVNLNLAKGVYEVVVSNKHQKFQSRIVII